VLTRRAGRPAVPLVPAPGAVAGVGLEVDGAYLGVRVVDLTGEVLAEAVDFGDQRCADPVTVVDRLVALLDPVLTALADEGVRVAGATVAVPGLVGTDGQVRLAADLGWHDVDLPTLLRTDPGLARLDPVVDNDADLAAAAELRVRPDDSFVYLCGETSLGGAVVVHREPLAGQRGWAGAIGHLVVDPTRGHDGTLDALAGPDALLRAAGIDPTGRAPALVAALEADDPKARTAVVRAGQALGVALASVVNLTDVSTVVLGGAYWSLADRLAPHILTELRRRVVSAPWTEFTVDRSAAGDLPALTGAAWASLGRVLDDPAAFCPG
jgi:predicted NBD/HSP70 family sugar kinase